HDSQKILIDPFAPAVFFPPAFSRAACARPGPTAGKAPLGVLPKHDLPFDWGDTPQPRHTHDTIVYELHVKGFTARANSGMPPASRWTSSALWCRRSTPPALRSGSMWCITTPARAITTARPTATVGLTTAATIS